MKNGTLKKLIIAIIFFNGISLEVAAQIFNPFPCNTPDLLPPACQNVCYRLVFQVEGTASNWEVDGLSSTGLSIDSNGVLNGVIQNGVLPGERNIIVKAVVNDTPAVALFRLPILAEQQRCTPCIMENEGRFPGQQPCIHEISFVFDRSANMASDLIPNGPSKWDILRGVFYGFLPAMAAVTDMDTDDRIAMTTLFSNQADINLFSIAVPPPTLSPTPSDGAAPLGGGIQRSLVDFFPELGIPGQGRNRTIILLTAGIQSRNPMIQLGRIIDTIQGEMPPLGIIQPPVSTGYGKLPINFDNPNLNEIGIYSIGLGTGITSSDHAILDDFSTEYGSTLEQGFILNDFLNSTIAKALNTGTPRVLGVRKGTFDPGTLATASFVVNDSVNSLTIQIFNVNKNFEEPKATLYKDERAINIQATFSNERTILYDINFPANNIGLNNPESSRGNWEIRFQDNTSFQYEVTGFVDETGIHYDIDFAGQEQFIAGDPLTVRVKLWDREGPVKNASVNVLVERPGADLGDLAANTPAPPLDPPANITKGQAKINYLVADPQFWQNLQKKTEKLTLEPSEDGLYTGTFTENLVTGTYRIITVLNGVHPRLGPFEGRASAFAFFDFGDNSTINANETIKLESIGRAGSQNWEVTLTPTNRTGKKIGPAQLSRIAAKVTAGNIYDWKDNLDGSYQFKVNTPRGSVPKLSIFIIDMEKPVVTRKLNKTRFGLSLHGGILRTINNTIPFDTLKEGTQIEVDMTFQFTPRSSLQLIGGQYKFEDKFTIRGVGLFYEYSMVKSSISGFIPRISGGIGYYEPENQGGELGLALRAGLARLFTPNLNIGLHVGAHFLPKPEYTFGMANLSLKYFF